MSKISRAALLAVALWVTACGGGFDRAESSAETADSSAAARAADVVLVTLDTLRYDALGLSGFEAGSGVKGLRPNPRSETPTLDELARQGRIYPWAHAHNVVTLPSHANILTGLYPYQHGIRDNTGFTLNEDIPTLATQLAAAGYATAAFVGAFPLDARFGLDRGFEVYDDDYPQGGDRDAFVIAERRGDEVVRAALDWWRANEGEKRFLWVHLYDPHAPYAPPEPWASRFRDEPYLGEVAATDAFLAPLLRPFLDGEGRPPGLVIVTSDHGEALGDHGEVTHGLFAYEASLRVPLILWGPGVEAGVDAAPAGHVDLLPTVLTALDLPVPEDLPGRSLLPGSNEAAADEEPFYYFEALSAHLNRGWAPLRGGLLGERKWIELPIPELYDLATDPGEETNLYPSDRQAASPLRRAMPDEKPWPPGRGQVDREEIARLRALGYLAAGDATRKTRFTPEDDPKKLVALDRMMHEVIDLYSRGRLEEAVTLARDVVARRPDMAVGYQHLALILRQLERPAEAVEVLEEALEGGVASTSLARELGLTLLDAGSAQKAIEVLQPLASEEDLESLVALGNAQFIAGRLDAARGTLGRALEQDPEDIGALEGLGAVALAAGRPDIARGYLEKALALNERLPIAWNSLGVARYQLGDRSGALAAWGRSAELDPRQYDALSNLGFIAAEAGQITVARSALERFVATAPPSRYASDLARARQLLSQLR